MCVVPNPLYLQNQKASELVTGSPSELSFGYLYISSLSVIWVKSLFLLCVRWKEGERGKQRTAEGQGPRVCKVTLRPAGLTDGLHRFHQMYFSLRCASFLATEQDTAAKLVCVSFVTLLVLSTIIKIQSDAFLLFLED